MAYVHEIKFYIGRSNRLYVALFDKPPFFLKECWIKNIPACKLGIEYLPRGFEYGQKYKIKSLGFEVFKVDKPEWHYAEESRKLLVKALKTFFTGLYLNRF